MTEQISTIGKPRMYTDDQLIEILQTTAKELERTPTSGDMRAKFGRPSFGTYQQRFGSFNAALEKAGLEPTRKSPKPVPREWVVQSKKGYASKEEAKAHLEKMENSGEFELRHVFADRKNWGRNP